jgi:hypothetical protein
MTYSTSSFAVRHPSSSKISNLNPGVTTGDGEEDGDGSMLMMRAVDGEEGELSGAATVMPMATFTLNGT